jgi:hypothetical protein
MCNFEVEYCDQQRINEQINYDTYIYLVVYRVNWLL